MFHTLNIVIKCGIDYGTLIACCVMYEKGNDLYETSFEYNKDKGD